MKTLKIIIGLIIWSISLNAQVILPPSDTIYIGFGQIFDIKVQGIYAYCYAETGLYRVNVNDPDNMYVKNHLPLPGGGSMYCKTLLSGGVALIANGTGGLEVVDIADTNSLIPVSSLDGLGNITELALKNDALYALNYQSDLIRIISIADSANPALMGSFNCSGTWYSQAYSMEVIGNYLFCAGRYSRIWRWNISSPFSPASITLMDQYWASDYRQTFYDAAHNYLFVADDDSEMKTYQVNPASGALTRITQSSWEGDAVNFCRIFRMNDYFYITSVSSDRTNIWNVSTISDPFLSNQINPSLNDYDNATCLFLTPGNCYLGVSSQVLSFPLNGTAVSGRVDRRGYFNDVTVHDQHLYAAAGRDGLLIYDLADPDHPAFMQQISFSSPVGEVYTDGVNDYLYCICNQGVDENKVHIVDITIPASPLVMGFMRVPWKVDPSNQYCNISEVEVKNNYAYVLYNYPIGYVAPELSDYGIAVFNIANKSTPALLGKYPTQSWPVSFLLDGDYLYTVERRYYAEPGVYTGTNCAGKYSILSPAVPSFALSGGLPDYPIEIAKGNDTIFIITGQIFGSSEPSANSLKYLDANSLVIDQNHLLPEIPAYLVSESRNLYLTNYNHELNIITKDPFEPVDSTSFNFSTGHFALNLPNIYLCNAYALITLSAGYEVPAERYLRDMIINTGSSECYDATQTIYLAGSGTTFMVQNGAEATLIAGQNILFHPGTSINSGADLLAYITTSGLYCGSLASSIVSATLSADAAASEDTDISLNGLFRVYPNTLTGKFTAELLITEETESATFQIFNPFENLILTKELDGSAPYEIDLSAEQPGIYVLKLILGERTDVKKIIKN